MNRWSVWALLLIATLMGCAEGTASNPDPSDGESKVDASKTDVVVLKDVASSNLDGGQDVAPFDAGKDLDTAAQDIMDATDESDATVETDVPSPEAGDIVSDLVASPTVLQVTMGTMPLYGDGNVAKNGLFPGPVLNFFALTGTGTAHLQGRLALSAVHEGIGAWVPATPDRIVECVLYRPFDITRPVSTRETLTPTGLLDFTLLSTVEVRDGSFASLVPICRAGSRVLDVVNGDRVALGIDDASRIEAVDEFGHQVTILLDSAFRTQLRAPTLTTTIHDRGWIQIAETTSPGELRIMGGAAEVVLVGEYEMTVSAESSDTRRMAVEWEANPCVMQVGIRLGRSGTYMPASPVAGARRIDYSLVGGGFLFSTAPVPIQLFAGFRRVGEGGCEENSRTSFSIARTGAGVYDFEAVGVDSRETVAVRGWPSVPPRRTVVIGR